MKLKELKTLLALHPGSRPHFILPDGDVIPAHFHLTEVGYVTKRFIDCGGTLHERSETCLLQTYVADDVEHRLNAGTFAKILELGKQVLPHDELEVEVEYDCCVVAQYPIASAVFAAESIEIQLGERHADCLAKEKCGIGVGDSCCGGADDVATGGPAVGCC